MKSHLTANGRSSISEMKFDSHRLFIALGGAVSSFSAGGNVSGMADDNSPVSDPRKRTVMRGTIAVLILAALGGGIALALSVGGSASPGHTSASRANNHKN